MKTTNTANGNTNNESKRNPNLSKWNILFEREGKQWMSVKPQEGNEVYTCYACRELFGSKNSFLDHVNRFTMVLNLKCHACAGEQVQYYNPCALLLHSRRHYSPFGGQVLLDDIQVLCLPYGLIGFPPHPDIPMMYDVEEEDANGSNINTRFYAPVRTNKGKNVITMIPTILLFYHYKLNGTPPVSLVLKQISVNVPKCMFIRLEQNLVSTNVTNPSTDRRYIPQGMISGFIGQTNFVDRNINKKHTEQTTNNSLLIIGNPLGQIIKQEIGDVGEVRPLTFAAINGSAPTMSMDTIVIQDVTCPECKGIIPADRDLCSHFINTNPLRDEFTCEVCNYIAASSCSFSAHRRLHFRESPYVCPECGREFDKNMALLDHMEETCFHLAKQVRLRCPKKNCCKVFAAHSTFMTHFEVHIQTLNKCTLCDASFYAVRDFVEHGHTVHSSIVPVELVYKCTLCKDSTLQAENFKEHVNMHCVDTNLRVYVYICKLCRNFFRSMSTYGTHVIRCSKKETTIEELRRLKKCTTSIVCLHCNYVVRLVTKLYDCPRCGKSINSACSAFDKKGFPLTKTKCIMCYEDLLGSDIEAHECVYKYPAVVLTREDDTIENILRTKRIPPEILNRGESYPKKKRSKTSPSPPKQKRPIAPNAELKLDEPVPFEGTYSCRVCEYNDVRRIEFHKHIKEHRSISTAYQCMECGECFVVKPSFQKHLMYYHKISDLDEYVMQNECVDEGAISELRKQMRIESGEISDDVAENQCKVCLKQFEDPLELNKHFRMHGMAFLRDNK